MTTDEDRVLRGVWRHIKSYRWRLRGVEKFEGEIENFILNTFINFKPVKRFENRSGVSEFRSFNNYSIHLFWCEDWPGLLILLDVCSLCHNNGVADCVDCICCYTLLYCVASLVQM